MSDFDPTKNRTPTGLLTLDEKSKLMSWPHGWQSYSENKWEDIKNPLWWIDVVYRGKPAPIVHHTYTNVYKGGRTGSPFSSLSEALENASEGRIKTIHITIAGNEVSATVLD